MTKIREILGTHSADAPEPPEDHAGSIADLSTELRSVLRLTTQIQSLVSAFQAPILKRPQFEFAASPIFDSHRRLGTLMLNAARDPFPDLSRTLDKLQRHNDVLDNSGWLPHHSTPFELVDACDTDPEALRLGLLQFYEERWPEVRQQIQRRLPAYELDDEARATFDEALDAHEAGLYRCVCRLLPPEVERLARIGLHGDKGKPRSSQPKLRRLAGSVRVSSITPRGLLALNLLRRLQTHLYEPVRPGRDRKRFEQDPVPNRHAALHGLVAYSSMQNSLNSIFMTEYLFQVITALKETDRLQAPS